MPALFRQRNFSLLWLAGLISNMGDWMLLVGLPIYVYTLTHSIAATSGSFLADQVPQILLGSVAGVFVDRWDRRWVLIIANIVLALGLLPLLLLRTSAQLWLIYAVAAFESIASQFLTAENALLPRLVSEEQLVAANSLNSFSSNAARLIGPALGGLVAVWSGLAGIALLDASTFLIAALLIALIVTGTVRFGISADAEKGKLVSVDSRRVMNSWKKIGREWFEGLQMIRRERVITGFFLVMSIAAFADGLFLVLFAPFVKTVLHGDAASVGYLTSAQAVGGLIGGLLVPRIAKLLSSALLITLSSLWMGLIMLGIFNYPAFIPGIWLAFTFFILIGIATIGFFVQLTTLLQVTVPDSYRGRIFGMYSVAWSFFLLLGTVLTGIVGNQENIVFLLDIEAGLFFPAALIAWLCLRPSN